jgi:hypothetical protein
VVVQAVATAAVVQAVTALMSQAKTLAVGQVPNLPFPCCEDQP